MKSKEVENEKDIGNNADHNVHVLHSGARTGNCITSCETDV
jgi:hypothetical protein